MDALAAFSCVNQCHWLNFRLLIALLSPLYTSFCLAVGITTCWNYFFKFFLAATITSSGSPWYFELDTIWIGIRSSTFVGQIPNQVAWLPRCFFFNFLRLFFIIYDFCLTPQSRTSHFHDVGRHYGGQKPDRPLEKCSSIHRMLANCLSTHSPCCYNLATLSVLKSICLALYAPVNILEEKNSIQCLRYWI